MEQITYPESYQDSAMQALKVPPHSVEAEQSVLGGLMLDNSAWEQVSDLLVEQDFYRHDHQLIFSRHRRVNGAGQPGRCDYTC